MSLSHSQFSTTVQPYYTLNLKVVPQSDSGPGIYQEGSIHQNQLSNLYCGVGSTSCFFRSKLPNYYLQFKTLFTCAKKLVWHAKFLVLCLNQFGTALPIYMTQSKMFFSSLEWFQFLIRTPSLHLFYSREMANKQL